MSSLFVLIPLSVVLLLCAAWGFVWAVSNGQFDDLETPAWDALADEASPPTENKAEQKTN